MTFFKKSVKNSLILFFWLGVWWGAALAVGQELFLPSPLSVIECGAKLVITADFWQTVAISILRILLGTASAIIAGTLLALVTSRSRILHDLFYPILTIVKATPVASFITLAIIWMGARKLPAFICALMVFPIVWAAVSDGIKAIDKKHVEIAKVFSFSFKKKIKLIYLPTVAPYFLSACKTSIGLAWKAGVAAEVLAVSPNSIGKELFNARTYYEVPELFAWTVTVIILSLVIELAVTKLFVLLGKKFANVRNYAENRKSNKKIR